MTMPGTIEFRQVPKPVPRDDEVLVRVRRIGVCGSDIHVYHGKHPYTTYPWCKVTRLPEPWIRWGPGCANSPPAIAWSSCPR